MLVVINRKAGRGLSGRRVAQVSRELAAEGYTIHEVDAWETLGPRAAELSRAGKLRAVIAAGGDGTVSSVLNTVPPGTPILVMPAGTENLLAKYLGSSARPSEIKELVRSGVAVPLDAGRANGRFFTLMISVGLDAEVVRQVQAKRKGAITHLAYAGPILQTVRTYRYPFIRATWADDQQQPQSFEGAWLFGVNLPRYAQGIPIAPDASGLDGLLDLCVLRKGSTLSGMWYLWNILRRCHHRLRSVKMQRCQSCRIESVSGEPIPFQLDGDPGGFLPVDVEIVPARLTMLVSRSTAEQLGFELPTSTI